MKHVLRSHQHHDLYRKYHDHDSEISGLLGECGLSKALDASNERIAGLTAERDAALAKIERQAATVQERFREVAFLTKSVEALVEEWDAALSRYRKPAWKEGLSNLRILIGGVVFYVVAIAAGLAYYFPW